MVRKLHIQENVVSDMYGLKIINMNDTKQYLQNYTYDINLEDCSLVLIDKPRTYATAKKSEFPILGVIDNGYMYVGMFANRGTVIECTNVVFEITGESQGA